MLGDKADLRNLMHVRRAALGVEDRRAAGFALAHYADELIALHVGLAPPTVSTYWAIGPELDLRPLALALTSRGCAICLPVIVGKAEPLIFRRHRHGDMLIERSWGIQEPAADVAVASPDILVVPLLAVDASGARLGYGGGYYDRTLRDLRRVRNVIAIGAAYDCQVVAAVPTEDYDEGLDWILTPAGLRRCVRSVGTPR